MKVPIPSHSNALSSWISRLRKASLQPSSSHKVTALVSLISLGRSIFCPKVLGTLAVAAFHPVTEFVLRVELNSRLTNLASGHCLLANACPEISPRHLPSLSCPSQRDPGVPAASNSPSVNRED